MRPDSRVLILILSLALLPSAAFGERWVEFHSESWSSRSEKLGRELLYSNRHYFDADSLKTEGGGDVLVSIREISQNDRFYMEKGIPEKEAVYKKILLDCASLRYEVFMEGEYEAGSKLPDGDKIIPGSMYDKLSALVCKGKAEKKKGKK